MTYYGCAPGNIVASVNLATTKKNDCATSYGCAPGNMVASVNLASPKKEIARPPMVGLLAIWLRSLTMVVSVNLATAIKDGCAKNGLNTDHTWESIGDTDHTWKSIGHTDCQSVNLATRRPR